MKTIWFLGLLLFVSACKKTKLEGDLSVLIGKWKYKYTIALSNSCVSYFGGPYITNDESTIGYDCSMTFIEKGKIVLKKGHKEDKYRVMYDPNFANNYLPSDTAFYFYLNKKNKQGIALFYHEYSGVSYLETPDFPKEITRDNCEYRISVFEKTE